MKQIFKLKKEAYYKARNQMISFLLGFMVCFPAYMCGIFYFTGTEIPKPSRKTLNT